MSKKYDPEEYETEDYEEERRPSAKKSKKKGTGVLIAVILAFLMLITAVLLYFFVLKDMLAYDKAGELFAAGRYAEAKTAYASLGEYKDSAVLVKKCDYRTAQTLFTAGSLEEAEQLFNVLGDYSDSRAWAENCRGAIRNRDYGAAKVLLSAGRYAEAREAFLALGNYSDSARQIKECDRLSAIALMEAGEYEAARNQFMSLGEYGDSAQMLTECDYRAAVKLLDEGDAEGAAELFAPLSGYKEADAMLVSALAMMAPEEIPEEEPEAAPEQVPVKVPEATPAAVNKSSEYDGTAWRVGSYVKFGHYPQQEKGTDNTPIEWLVLEKKGDKVLLLSRYALDSQPYYTKLRVVTWENCSLRLWLNDEFIYKAFTASENGAIALSRIDNSREQSVSNTLGGNDTQDKIFLLSSAEVEKYFPDKADRTCAPTAYADKQGVYVHQRTGNVWWWVRSPGKTQSTVASINFEGGRTDYGVDRVSGGVRPALWVDTALLP